MDYDSAEIYFSRAIELYEAYKGHFNEETAGAYINLSIVHKRLYHFKKALAILNEAEKILQETSPESYYYSYIFNNKANIYFTYSDFDEAENYYKNSLDFLIKIDSINNEVFSTITLNLFNVLIAEKRNTEVKNLMNEIRDLDIKTTKGLFKKYMFLAQAHDFLGETEIAISDFFEAQKYLSGIKYDNPIDNIELNFRLASIYIKENKLEQAHELLLKNIEIFQSLKTLDFARLSETYMLIGEIYYQKGEYKNAYQWLQNSISELQNKLTLANLDLSINSSKILNNIFIDIKHSLAKTCVVLYDQTNDKKYLEQALNLYSDIFNALIVFRLHMKNEASKLRNTESRLSLMHEAITIAMEMYNITKDRQYYDLAFLYAQNTKSFVLLSEIKSTEVIKFSELPDNLIDREYDLSNEIAAYEEMIFNEQTSFNPDSIILTRFREKLFNLNDDYNTLIDSIELNYPKYFELKYNPKFFSPSEIQEKIRKNEALVEYVLIDSILTTFVIDSKKINVIQQTLSPDFPEQCISYFSLLQNQDFSNDVHATYKEYVQMARNFYEILIAPVLEVTRSRDITFIPDGEIMYLPFESFLTYDVDQEYINYRKLPYLIYDVSVGYSYSSTLLYSERIRSKSPIKKVLAYAPSYENLLGDEISLVWNRQANPDMLMPLPGARDEVRTIAQTVPSVVFLDENASEENFKKNAPNYSILHLAMHTIMDDENPMYSKLAFTRDLSDTTQDYNLYTYEIYNMKLNASMVVLSSCSSGFGKMQKGEGMMSMSRGFIYAGCPSIVMTLWQVSDLSSADLMSSFYMYLKKGYSKKKSLREAKIDYLRKSDNLKSNPYFWSAFMLVGDSSPLYGPSPIIFIMLALVVLIAGYFIYKYRHRLVSIIRKK